MPDVERGIVVVTGAGGGDGASPPVYPVDFQKLLVEARVVYFCAGAIFGGVLAQVLIAWIG